MTAELKKEMADRLEHFPRHIEALTSNVAAVERSAWALRMGLGACAAAVCRQLAVTTWATPILLVLSAVYAAVSFFLLNANCATTVRSTERLARYKQQLKAAKEWDASKRAAAENFAVALAALRKHA